VTLKPPQSADPDEVIDCLLPGQIRQLGGRVTYVTERRPVRTTAEDCAIRGGEYVAHDRADYATARALWTKAAQDGDVEAQYYVGVLFEREGEYGQAAQWYRKAADRGFGRAAVNLGRLYEQGLGVERNTTEAAKWYAAASGLKGDDLARLQGQDIAPDLGTSRRESPDAQQIEALRRRLDEVNRDLADARSRLSERTSVLEEERRRRSALEKQIKKHAETAPPVASRPNPAVHGEAIDRSLQAREAEVVALTQRVASLAREAKGQADALQALPVLDRDVPGPRIEMLDPLVVVTRGVRVEQGRIPLTLPNASTPRLMGRVLARAGLRSLTVNERQTPVDERGEFTVTLPAARGKDDRIAVDMLAVDTQGKQGTLRLILLPPGSDLEPHDSGADGSGFGRYYALVIGNNHYRQWTPLNTAITDATEVGAALTRHYGFDVTLLIDATRKDVLKALNDFRKRLTDRDNLLIYYAGHGYLEPQIDRGYWVPVDGDLEDNSDWIEFPAITDLLQLIAAKQILIVADSCFAGKLTPASIARISTDVSAKDRRTGLHVMASKRIRTALTSGGVKPVLDEGGEGHSIFAQAFLSVLQENDTTVETERLFWAVRARVVQKAHQLRVEQIPTYAPIHMAGHEGLGDFVFVPAAQPAVRRQ
jgi:uncharacterized caspase-like protein